MRSLLIFSMYLLLFPCFAAAQSRSFECAVGKKLEQEKAQTLVAEVQSQYGKVTSLRAKFIQESYLASLDVSETSEGTMLFDKPGSMRWDYTAPEEQSFIINDNVVYLYQPLDKQLVIDQFDAVLISDLPVAFLMGIGNLVKDFTLLSACENADGVVLDLEPKRAEKDSGELRELKLLVSPRSAMPLGGKVIDVSGNITAIVLKNIEHNVQIDAGRFKADFPKGIDVSDRRNERDE